MKSNESDKWDIVIDQWVKEFEKTVGVYVTVDNGDSQYLTIEEYKQFINGG